MKKLDHQDPFLTKHRFSHRFSNFSIHRDVLRASWVMLPPMEVSNLPSAPLTLDRKKNELEFVNGSIEGCRVIYFIYILF